MNHTDVPALCRTLLSFVQSGRLDDIRALGIAGDHGRIVRLADVHLKSVLAFAATLDAVQRAHFIQAIAILEDAAGGLGSVTMLQHLLPLSSLSEADEALLDWILQNTRSYAHYTHYARSVAAFHAAEKMKREMHVAAVERERLVQLAARQRKAIVATTRLFDAVRRRDLLAVKSLLLRGADPGSYTPEGLRLIDFAAAHRLDAIQTALLRALEKKAAETSGAPPSPD